MIKRTAEKILAWIGVGFQVLVIVAFAVMLWGLNTQPDTLDEIAQRDGDESALVLKFISSLGLIGTVGSVILLILGIVGAVLINKHEKASGILLLIAGILALLINWITGLLWIIAGIMLLVRKPDQGQGYYNDASHGDYSQNSDASSHRDTMDTNDYQSKVEKDPYKY